MKRENELLLKGANVEITKVLKNFDEMMNATLGDTVTITTGKEVIARKATLQDTIDFMQNEWFKTMEQLSELGIEIEAGVEKEAPKHHYEVYDKLSRNNKETYLDYNGIAVRFDKIFIDENGAGDSILELHRNGIADEIATILLKGNKEYEVIESEQGRSLELIEK